MGVDEEEIPLRLKRLPLRVFKNTWGYRGSSADRKQIPQLYTSKVIFQNDILLMSRGHITTCHLEIKDDLLNVVLKSILSIKL